MRLTGALLPARIAHLHPAKERAERRRVALLELAPFPARGASALLVKIGVDLLFDHHLLELPQHLLTLRQGQAHGFQRRLGSCQGDQLLAAFRPILSDGDHFDAEVHGGSFLQLAESRVHGAAVEGDRSIRGAFAHPVQRIHELRILIGGPRPTLIEIEHPLRYQEQILVNLLQHCPGAALCEQVLIARWATAVLWWTVPGAADAHGVYRAGIARQHLFQAQVMLPEVPHVVLVEEAFARAQLEIGEGYFPRIVVEPDAAITVNAILLAMDPKPMQMQILPAHRGLDDGVQLGNSRVAGYQQPAPNQGTTLTEPNLKLIHRGVGLWLRDTHRWFSWWPRVAARFRRVRERAAVRKQRTVFLVHPLRPACAITLTPAACLIVPQNSSTIPVSRKHAPELSFVVQRSAGRPERSRFHAHWVCPRVNQ